MVILAFWGASPFLSHQNWFQLHLWYLLLWELSPIVGLLFSLVRICPTIYVSLHMPLASHKIENFFYLPWKILLTSLTSFPLLLRIMSSPVPPPNSVFHILKEVIVQVHQEFGGPVPVSQQIPEKVKTPINTGMCSLVTAGSCFRKASFMFSAWLGGLFCFFFYEWLPSCSPESYIVLSVGFLSRCTIFLHIVLIHFCHICSFEQAVSFYF